MSKKWSKTGDIYYLGEVSTQVDKLDKGIYKLDLDKHENFFLTRTKGSFSFPYKIYGKETDFIKRVSLSYENTKGNFGVLLNGIKGTGKTVTAELICNELNLPVIIVSKKFKDLNSYLNDLVEDVIIFFDEYEKIYNDYNDDILTVMDGVLSNQYRKVFLLTTNSIRVNDNLLQRPSRIRYVKTFKDLEISVIEEIIDDKLLDITFRKEIIDFISKLEIITIDIVKSIIDEVNIHNELPESFKHIFNIKSLDSFRNVYELELDGSNFKETLINTKVKIIPVDITADEIGNDFRVGNRYMGEIESILSDDIFIVTNEIDDDDDEVIRKTYRVENYSDVNKLFKKYAF